MDDVMIALMDNFVKVFNQKYKDTKTITDITSWTAIHVDWGLSNEGMWDIFKQLEQEEVPLLDINIPKMLLLLNLKHHVDIVTAKSTASEEIKQKVRDRLTSLGIRQGEHYKNLVVIPYDENGAKAKLDYDIYIDDSPHLFRAIAGNPNKKLYLYDRPWNCACDDYNYSNIVRVYTWYGILKELY